MDRELEIGAAASAGGWLRWRQHQDTTLPVGTPCPNCQTPLMGAYCHACGQLGEVFERSVWALIVEGFESFFHFDGRFWQTLPALALKPGKLTHDYLAGRRASQIPPLRLFLVVLIIVFFAGGLNLAGEKAKSVKDLPAAERAKVDKALADKELRIGQVGDNSVVRLKFSPDDKPGPDGKVEAPSKADAWLARQGRLAVDNPELFKMILESWGHRFAILMLPISALMLSLLFVFQRRFYVFDHLIFSIHSLSFQGLLLSLVLPLSDLFQPIVVLLALAPVHLFVHMRGAYGTSVFGTLLRMTLLFIGSLIAVLFLMLGLVWVGLSALPSH